MFIILGETTSRPTTTTPGKFNVTFDFDLQVTFSSLESKDTQTRNRA